MIGRLFNSFFNLVCRACFLIISGLWIVYLVPVILFFFLWFWVGYTVRDRFYPDHKALHHHHQTR